MAPGTSLPPREAPMVAPSLSVYTSKGMRSARACPYTPTMARFLKPGVRNFLAIQIRMSSEQLGELGKGAGKGGGGGGAVREAGGAFGKREAAQEEMYFKKKEKEQLAALRQHHEEEIDHHKKEIERLQHEIKRHQDRMSKLKNDS